MSELIPSELKVTDLRKELLARNLSTAGLKKDLVERLEEALKVSSDPASPEKDDSDQIDLNPPNELGEDADLDPANGKNEGSADGVGAEQASLKRKGSHDDDDDSNNNSNTEDVGISMAVDASLGPESKQEESKSSDATNATAEATGLMDSLYVKNLERPLTVYRFEEFLASHSAVKKVWLNSIKTRGYARFETAEGAKAALDAINGIKFPPEHGKVLECGLITEKRMNELIGFEDTMSETVRTNDLVVVAANGENCGIKLVNTAGKGKNANKKQKTEKSQDASAEKGSKAAEGAGRSAAVVAAAANAAAQEARDQPKDGARNRDKGSKAEKPIKIKNDSFTLRTKFEPSIAYRPLTDEEVAAKKAAAGKA
ncbi:hypothetical protein H4R99_005722 [Coemansia sp. RSA 1722]|nr:hypothetical protein LPJ57_006072 [Coemansia sp. RSA 486]KAJ2229415.1 hypothetical protein IWW45_006209 [Coemansia sp. RSA 485]KAJ2594550.1 hypothetical protein H4R99_005722 [Coemansia sp. RSA 1722]